MTGGPISGYGDAKTLGSTAADELWKAPEDAQPRPLQIQYSIEEVEESEDLNEVTETVFEDPNEAQLRPRLLVPLQSVLGLKALCEREYIRTEAVTELLNQCRTAYYKELLYLREQLILAAEPEKQMMLGAVQNYEVYFFNPPAYVDEDLREYMLNCSRWTHKKLIEENYELQMKLSGAGQNDVFDNADFCLKGLLRRHGTYQLFKVMHRVVSNAKDLFNPEDLIRRQETEGLKPLEELQAAVDELFPNRGKREDNSGPLLNEISELQKALNETKAELARIKALLESERSRSEELAKKCDDQERQLHSIPEATPVVDTSGKVQELNELAEKMQLEADAQAERLAKMIKDLASGKSYQLGRSRPDTSKVFPKLDEAILDLDKLFAKIAKESPQLVTMIQSSDDGTAATAAQKEIAQLKQEILSLKSKLAAAEQREQEALAKLKELQKRPRPSEAPGGKMPESPSNAGALPDNTDELKKQLERKIAKVAELEADLDQAQKDLRAAQRTIDEKDLLLQERSRKDAEHAKKMSDLMEKLRKSEEEAEKLAAKLYKADEKIKNLKEQIRNLKNQLGLKHEESEEEVEEEVDTTQTFMSRYYLRAKNSGKPRWMLLSEDAKYKSQKKNQEENQKAATGGGWTSGMHQPDPNQAFQFLRKPQGAGPGHGTMVRLQYSFSQQGSLGDPADSPGPGDGGFPGGFPGGGFNRMNSFQQLQHPAAPGSDYPMSPDARAGAQRLMHAKSMPFSMEGDRRTGSPPGGPLARQGSFNSNLFGRSGTPPQQHPIYAPGGGSIFHSASWRGGAQATSTGPAYTSSMSGPLQVNSMRQDLGQASSGLRLGTPPTLPQVLHGSPLHNSPGGSPLPSSWLPQQTAGSPATPGGLVAPDEDVTTSTGLPLSLPNAIMENRAQPTLTSSSSFSLSPTSSRMANVSLAMRDPLSPQDAPMLQLIPQPQDAAPLEPLERRSQGLTSMDILRAASWSSFSGIGASEPTGPVVVNIEPAIEESKGLERDDVPSEPPREPREVKARVLQHARTTPDLEKWTPKAAKGAPSEVQTVQTVQGDAVDMLMEHARSQPLGVKREASFLSWGRRPKINGSLPLTNAANFKGKMRPVVGSRTSPNLESAQYIQADSLPRLPGGKVRKAAQPASWLSPL